MNRLAQRALLAMALFTSFPLQYAAAQTSQTVGGIEINYGVVRARDVAAAQDKDPAMHERKRRRRSAHHLVVALSDAKTGERITDATVVATVTPLGLAPSKRKLQQMRVDGTTSYGNYFDFPASSAPFRISLSITRPAHSPVTAEFQYSPATR